MEQLFRNTPSGIASDAVDDSYSCVSADGNGVNHAIDCDSPSFGDALQNQLESSEQCANSGVGKGVGENAAEGSRTLNDAIRNRVLYPIELPPQQVVESTSREQLVYAIRQKDRTSAPVKIGIAANVQQRIDDLQTANPNQLIVLIQVPGGRPLERAIHRLLRPWRRSGEWFSTGDVSITNFCQHLKKRDFRDALLRFDLLETEELRQIWAFLGIKTQADWVMRLVEPGEASGLVVTLERLGNMVHKRWSIGDTVAPSSQQGFASRSGSIPGCSTSLPSLSQEGR